ncbi:MAG: alpha/beta fold hydrolase [Bacterioplanes sp.]|nr:alpha/beta fold hydrolase [Bacterioplanes sp.]
MAIKYTMDGNEHTPCLVLAHGAGASSRSEWMNVMTSLLVAQGICVVRFDFPYMSIREQTGVKRPPDRMPVLQAHYHQLLVELDRPVIIGGKSMGGRVASLLAAEDTKEYVRGCVCLGYPFHPNKKPDALRIAHWSSMSMPLLIVQGERDAMGNRQEVATYGLEGKAEWCWLPDGDHDLKPRKRSGFTFEQHMEQAAVTVAAFVKQYGESTVE